MIYLDSLSYSTIYAENVDEFNLNCKNVRDDHYDILICYNISLYLPSNGLSDINIII